MTLYRVPFVCGDSQTGVWNTKDFLSRMFKACIELQAVPKQDAYVDTLPVDYVADLIVDLALKAESVGRVFHLSSPKGLHWSSAIAAHEGWHQYTQTTFQNPLPVWLEEGLACYMEGFGWNREGTGTPTFNAWKNPERFDALARAYRENRLQPLDSLFRYAPQDFNRVRFSEVQRLADTCPTGCAIVATGPVEALGETGGFRSRLAERGRA